MAKRRGIKHARPPANPNPLLQVDPYLGDSRIPDGCSGIYGLAALGFMVVFATLTCGAHFVCLTAGRQIQPSAYPQLWRQLSIQEWPSLALAVEFLAWHFFFGLAMLFASLFFRGNRLQTYVRTSMMLSGRTTAGARWLAGSPDISFRPANIYIQQRV